MGLLIFLTLLFIFLTVYVYAGYFIVLLILEKLLPSPEAPAAGYLPSISLIIAAFNEEDVIRKKLENTRELDYPSDKLQVMVVADGSSDATADIAREFENEDVLVLFSPERKGKSAAINRGVQEASGDILVFSDANAYYLPDALQNLVIHYADESVGCVSGRKTVRKSDSQIAESEGLYWRFESSLKKLETKTGSTVAVVGEMNSLRRSLFEPIPGHIINDDSFLALRILSQAYRVVYEPGAISWETSAATTSDEIKRRQRINAGRYQQMFMLNLWTGMPLLNMFKLISHKFFRLLLPFFMIGAFLFNTLLLLMPDTPLLMTILWFLQFAAYDAALMGYVLERAGKKNKILSAVYYIVSSNIAALRGFIRHIRGQQTVLWEKANRSATTGADH